MNYDLKVRGAATCSTETACAKDSLCVQRMIVASSVLPDMPEAIPVNVKRTNLNLQNQNLNMSEIDSWKCHAASLDKTLPDQIR